MNEMREQFKKLIQKHMSYPDKTALKIADEFLALLPMKEEVKDDKLAFIHAKDARIKELEKALDDIIKHMNIVGGDYASLSTVVVIAGKAREGK